MNKSGFRYVAVHVILCVGSIKIIQVPGLVYTTTHIVLQSQQEDWLLSK